MLCFGYTFSTVPVAGQELEEEQQEVQKLLQKTPVAFPGGERACRFVGVRSLVDLCRYPGGWSNLVMEKIGPSLPTKNGDGTARCQEISQTRC